MVDEMRVVTPLLMGCLLPCRVGLRRLVPAKRPPVLESEGVRRPWSRCKGGARGS